MANNAVNSKLLLAVPSSENEHPSNGFDSGLRYHELKWLTSFCRFLPAEIMTTKPKIETFLLIPRPLLPKTKTFLLEIKMELPKIATALLEIMTENEIMAERIPISGSAVSFQAGQVGKIFV